MKKIREGRARGVKVDPVWANRRTAKLLRRAARTPEPTVLPEGVLSRATRRNLVLRGPLRMFQWHELERQSGGGRRYSIRPKFPSVGAACQKLRWVKRELEKKMEA